MLVNWCNYCHMEGESNEDTHKSMELTSLLSELSTKKQCIICCKPTYQMRKLKNKGAIVVLVWNFFVVSVFNYFMAFVVPYGLETTAVALGLTLPFAGWLADIHFGRYKVIRWSMWIMWTASILNTINSVIAQFLTENHRIYTCISLTMTSIMAIGFGGYQANIIQFGLDQLQDSSTTEITAFITWYVWTYYSNGALFDYTHICVKPNYYVFGQLLVCMSITVVISSSYFLQSSLVKEPVTQNPFKLIYKVIRYAIKNKHPLNRSAFTYCEDELPSRIDFGKSKYGGPFTTEQVEDVKTFFRLLVIVAIAGILMGEVEMMVQFNDQLIKIFQHAKSTLSLKECYTERFSIIAFGYGAIAILIPINEFTFYPLLQKCFSSIKIYQKFLVGILLQIARIIILITYDVTARKAYIEQHSLNITIQCNYPGSLSWSSYRNWMVIPNLFGFICIAMLSISSIEFLASQTPYSMRGLMVGAGYGSVFLFTMIAYGIYWPFTRQSSTWGTGIISCEFWYLLSVLVVLIIVSGILLGVGRWYKNRKRQDVLPNEHIFAERYYSK